MSAGRSGQREKWAMIEKELHDLIFGLSFADLEFLTG
jgi:hypothetical protein